jgi:hypothetical protein
MKQKVMKFLLVKWEIAESQFSYLDYADGTVLLYGSLHSDHLLFSLVFDRYI